MFFFPPFLGQMTNAFTNATIKKPITHTIPACYSCKISACCMHQNNKPEFQRNIKLEYAVQYNNKIGIKLRVHMTQKRCSKHHTHICIYTSTVNITHMIVSNFLQLSWMLLGVPCLQVGHRFRTQFMSIMALQKYKTQQSAISIQAEN